MAQSQGLFAYSHAIQGALSASLSGPRLTPYVAQARQDTRLALQYYLFNARISKSLLYPLHVYEVLLRNHWSSKLGAHHGPHWPQDASFLNLIPQEARDALADARRCLPVARRTTDDVVAKLPLEFWSKLFQPVNYRNPWYPKAIKAFVSTTQTIEVVRTKVERILRLRNRIAHHEAIFNRPLLRDTYNDIVLMVRCIDSTTHGWLQAHSTFQKMVHTEPNSRQPNGLTVGDRYDSNFVKAVATDSVDAMRPHVGKTLLVYDNDQLRSAMTFDHIGNYLVKASAQAGGLIELHDHPLAHVIADQQIANNFGLVSESTPLAAMTKWFKKTVRATAVITDAQANVCGVVHRAHRNYWAGAP